MQIYNFLSKKGFTKRRYALKFFLVALPVILLPLIELSIFVMMSRHIINISLVAVGIITVILTLTAAVVMYVMYDNLLSPLHLAKKALNNYVNTNELPQLPVHHEDEAGQLLGDIQTTITQMELLLTEKSDMIDLLSHDLRSPVGRILSLSSLIKSDDDGSKDMYADYITSECKGLLRVLENILMMLKEENSAFTLSNVNLKNLLQETVGFFDFPIADKHLNIAMSIDDSVHVVVQQDLFTQAVRNILGNAIKFSPEGSSIFISVKHDENQIALSIKDQGLGFAPADMKRIFDRFTRAGKKGTHGETSMGLGLYLSKKIVEKHGGRLVAESPGVNKGATFTIYLHRLVIKKRQGKINTLKGAKKRQLPVLS